jgi:hypothetical protein
MVRCRPDLLTVLVAASVWFLTPPGAVAQDSAGPESLHWSVPPVLPPGALIAVVSGDPTGPGEFTLLVSMPKEGTLLVGTGDQLDPKMTQALAAGDSATAPAGMHHFSIAKGRTLLSATFVGPYTITYVRAEDAPRPRTFPFGY